jgi:hypothetical protein
VRDLPGSSSLCHSPASYMQQLLGSPSPVLWIQGSPLFTWRLTGPGKFYLVQP